jgi:medium-chain acyl-[acyl-carrier-protein] hydrolase
LRQAVDPIYRIVCFPYAGGGASGFRSWAPLMRPGVELYAIQPPGRESRITEANATEFSETVPHAADAVAALLDDPTPVAFFGHSLGALVAYALTQRLERRGARTPSRLLVSACVAPHRRGVVARVHDLPDAEFIDWVRALGGTPDEVWEHAELRQMLLPILRADFRVFATFAEDAGAEPLATPIAAFGGVDDRSIPYDGLAGWQQRTRGEFSLFMSPGDHFFIQSAREAVVARVLRVLLDSRAARNQVAETNDAQKR